MKDDFEIIDAQSLGVRHGGLIVHRGCPWAEAAERLSLILGRPAATIAKLVSDQIDLYTHSVQDDAHQSHDREWEEWCRLSARYIDQVTNEQIIALSAPSLVPVSTIKKRAQVTLVEYSSCINAIDDLIKWFYNEIREYFLSVVCLISRAVGAGGGCSITRAMTNDVRLGFLYAIGQRSPGDRARLGAYHWGRYTQRVITTFRDRKSHLIGIYRKVFDAYPGLLKRINYMAEMVYGSFSHRVITIFAAKAQRVSPWVEAARRL